MKLTLNLLMVGLWAMLLAISAFLVLIVAPLGEIIEGSRLFVSALQAVIAIVAVILFIMALSRLKRAYVNRKIRPA